MLYPTTNPIPIGPTQIVEVGGGIKVDMDLDYLLVTHSYFEVTKTP